MRKTITCKASAIACAFIAVAGFSLPATAQIARSRTLGTTSGTAHEANSPFTAEYKITQVQTLPNGTTITHDSTELKARDSQGRRFLETTIASPSGDQTPTTIFSVFDPATRTVTMWNTPGKRVTVFTMSTPGAAHDCSTTTAAPRVQGRSGKSTHEDLGMQTILDIESHGQRTSTTIPAGAIGNDAPLVRSFEIWTAVAPGLKGTLMREISDDPRSGTRTSEIVSLTQGEPDTANFQPPEGYETVNKTTESGCPETTAIPK
jgi:hypothetical protein